MNQAADNLRSATDAVLAQNAALAARVAQLELERDEATKDAALYLRQAADLTGERDALFRQADEAEQELRTLRILYKAATEPKPSWWERFWTGWHERNRP